MWGWGRWRAPVCRARPEDPHRASQGGLEAPAENADPWAHPGPVNPKPPSRVPLADRWGPPKVLAHPGSKRLPVLHVSLQGAWQTE